MKKYKKLKTKKIDIDKEKDGLSTGPVEKKIKKPDLTDNINSFLDNPISLDEIKNILIKLSKNIYYEDYKIKIFSIPYNRFALTVYHDFIIIISNSKYTLKFYLSDELYELKSFKIVNLCTSKLKQSLNDIIRDWCTQNLDKKNILKI